MVLFDISLVSSMGASTRWWAVAASQEGVVECNDATVRSLDARMGGSA
jgi:hypothetical protein